MSRKTSPGVTVIADEMNNWLSDQDVASNLDHGRDARYGLSRAEYRKEHINAHLAKPASNTLTNFEFFDELACSINAFLIDAIKAIAPSLMPRELNSTSFVVRDSNVCAVSVEWIGYRGHSVNMYVVNGPRVFVGFACSVVVPWWIAEAIGHSEPQIIIDLASPSAKVDGPSRFEVQPKGVLRLVELLERINRLYIINADVADSHGIGIAR